MTRARLLILLILCAVWPAVAHAQSDTADWAQGGSGPGPYTAPFTGYEVRVWCLPTSAAANTAQRRAYDCLLNDPEKTQAVLSFGQMFASSGNKQLFVDDPTDVRDVKLRRYTTAFTYRANAVLSVGGTVDAIQYTSDQGNAFSFWRLGLGPRLVFTPFGAFKPNDPNRSALSQIIHLQVDTTWLPQGIKASDYNNTVSRYNPGATFQVRTTLAIDYAFVLQAIHH
jgi:hypothetical protein